MPLPPRDDKGRFRRARYRRDGAGRWRDDTGRFVSADRVLSDRKRRDRAARRRSATRAAEERSRTGAERGAARLQGIQQLARLLREHYRQSGAPISWNDAQKLAGENVPRQLDRAFDRPIRGWTGSVRDGKQVWTNDVTGEERSSRQMETARLVTRYWQAVYNLAAWKGYTISEARSVIAERYGGDWREALRENSPGKG